ncbi:phospholipase a2 domain-containing protein [Ditylenchus destructor]|uniref:phospholipase A2 n=1 Tax=Ditylenchus destructor TaxID=166010 RepID=A0AAD4MSW2_9BILA|nr:phospholipase a2 domain-containing protein [Ditylenchus destructor]
MSSLLFRLILIFAFCAPTVWLSEEVQDRNIVPNLGWMMARRLGVWNPVKFLAYIRHGCYCGLGKKGDIPVDGIDKCCMEHDAWECDAYFSCSEITCTSTDQCEKTICECDKTFVNCLTKFPEPSVSVIFENNCKS